jgi:hypothetical protein
MQASLVRVRARPPIRDATRVCARGLREKLGRTFVPLSFVRRWRNEPGPA